MPERAPHEAPMRCTLAASLVQRHWVAEQRCAIRPKTQRSARLLRETSYWHRSLNLSSALEVYLRLELELEFNLVDSA